jgi:hypothetical protein
MRAQKNLYTITTATIGALLLGAALLAQGPPPPPGPPGMGFHIDRFEMGFRGRTVTGSPFSAQSSTETVQTLADGNRIDRTNTGMMYRDSQGRTRLEENFKHFGPMPASGTAGPMVFINDPVAGMDYILNPNSKTAQEFTRPTPKGGRAQGGNGRGQFTPRNNPNVTTQTETQSLEGLTVQYTRVTRTIPAGQIGNANPIQTIFERWYSPGLQMVIKSVDTNPEFGTTTFQLTNINRSEPDASFFQVPSDYTVSAAKPRAGRRFRGNGPPPPPPPPQE